MDGLFDDDEILPDDDYHEELGVDYHEIHPGEREDFRNDNPDVAEVIEDTPPVSNSSNGNSHARQRIKIKAMPLALRQKFPSAISILFTNRDGTQILLVGD
jgi:hypothetical protein